MDAHKDTITPYLSDEMRAHFDERAAIVEFDGNLSREEAQTIAYKCVVHRFYPKAKDCYPLD